MTKKKSSLPLRAARREDATRMCRRCARLVVETDFLAEDWICSLCLNSQPAMPLKDRGEHQRYDTSKVFAGLRVKRIPQGLSREQFEVEVPSQFGEFYPVAENCVGLLTTTTRIFRALLDEFPTCRAWTEGGDGRCVIHIPVEVFPKVAKRCKAFKSRKADPSKPIPVEEQVRRDAAAERLKAYHVARQMSLDI